MIAIEKLNKSSVTKLKELCKELNIKCTGFKKRDLIEVISKQYNLYENYKNNEEKKYEILDKIGNKGKDGVCYIVKKRGSRKRELYVKKQFRKSKSDKKIIQEYEIQSLASQLGVAPRVYEYNIIDNYIIMEKMDKHILQLIEEQRNKLTQEQQYQILEIYDILSSKGILHNDNNILNLMVKGKRIYLIDYGMSKIVNSDPKELLEKCLLGYILPLYKKGLKSCYNYLLKYVDISVRRSLGIST